MIKKVISYTGAQIIYRKLLEHNVKDVFLYSGGSIMPLIDQFYERKDRKEGRTVNEGSRGRK